MIFCVRGRSDLVIVVQLYGGGFYLCHWLSSACNGALYYYPIFLFCMTTLLGFSQYRLLIIGLL